MVSGLGGSMKVRFDYYKESGKWYYSAEAELEVEFSFEAFTKARDMLEEGKRPGLIDGANEFYTVITIVDGELAGLSHLILPKARRAGALGDPRVPGFL